MHIEIVEYSWWGGENSPPKQFKTTKQLKEPGLTVIAPVGIIRTALLHQYSESTVTLAAPLTEGLASISRHSYPA